MDVPTVGNPVPLAATPSPAKQGPADPPREPQPSSQPTPQVEAPATEAGRTKAELERLADEVVSIFEDSPERLEELVATLKRLETGSTRDG